MSDNGRSLDLVAIDVQHSRFVVDPEAGLLVKRQDVAYIAEALCRVTSGQRREGVKDLARALGIEEVTR